MATADHGALPDAEAGKLFSGLETARGLVLAVSGGADSTALLVLAARWAKAIARSGNPSPKLLAATIDHGLRPSARREAAGVRRLARALGVAHRTLRWRGEKPTTGVQEAAREARYRLLADAARRTGSDYILTGHTLDDQAETVLFRLARGSGVAGLAAMARISPLPVEAARPLFVVRPFLSVPKARLVATLRQAGVAFSEDPTNADPRFARPRLRQLMPYLAQEGLDARGLARLAARMRRADATIEFAVAAARAALAPQAWSARGPIGFDAAHFRRLPSEVALRLLGRAVAHVGSEGPVELGKLETLCETLLASGAPLRRTLAGASIVAAESRIVVERAPPRRRTAKSAAGNRRFTKSS